MIGDLVEARLLLIRAEIHLEWLCKESRAARELVADIQKFLTLSDSFEDSCGTVEGHGQPIAGGTGSYAKSVASGYQAPPAGIDTASENEDAGAGAEASSAPDRFDSPSSQERRAIVPANMSFPQATTSASHCGKGRGVQNESGRGESIQNGAVTDPGFLIARTPFAAREDRNKPPCPPVLCNPERPSIVKARKV